MAVELAKEYRRLNLGCGRDILPGWINLDSIRADGVDLVADLDDCENTPLPFADDSIDEFLASHVIEHLHNPLPFMEELHRVAKPGASGIFKVPYGSSDEAFEDPTHVRPYFSNSFQYFSQPVYWKADYGYRGDWLTERMTFLVAPELKGASMPEALHEIHYRRNIVREMTVRLRAIKPIREQKQELIVYPEIEILLCET